MSPDRVGERWPSLPLDEWQETYATLHMTSQILGKVRLALSPFQNHWWHTALYVTPRGLTTSAIPYRGGAFSVDLDLTDHAAVVRLSGGATRGVPLLARPVAEFYREFMQVLDSVGITVRLNTLPNEVPDPIRFEEDRTHAAYDPPPVERFHRILLSASEVFARYRSDYIGKCSPVHFFWGSFDLCVTRFSGRRAPERPDADPVTREAYSHEVSSVGFWPGGGGVDDPAFYAYTVPEPAGLREAPLRPDGVYFAPALNEHVLLYDRVREEPDPDAALIAFCRSTYEAGATLGGWDRASLERDSATHARGG